ncbi:MAG: VCBS repeat-containing protein, partial [Ekhidna sp.]|nr:VCBS repeat-containing protein [Ekhidna sp.]
YLGLTRNSLTGEIPVELSNLFNLDVLALGGNQLSGNIPADLGNLTNLTELYLWGNQLEGAAPVEIGNLLGLAWLQISGNNLGGPIPASYNQLINLGNFTIASNKINGLPDLTSLTNLTSFDISFNRIPEEDILLNESVITQNLGQLYPVSASDSVALVSIYDAMFGESWDQSTWFNDIVATWEGVGATDGRVTSLDLNVLGASGNLPDEIGDLNALVSLDIAGTGADEINSSIQDFADLSFLDISSNRLDFNDLAPYVDFVRDTLKTLFYSNQARFTQDELIVEESATVINVVVPAFNGASYSWFNDDVQLVGTSNAINFNLATDNRPNLRAQSTHPDFPDLTLFSGVFKGRVNYFNTTFDSIDPYFSFDPTDSLTIEYENSIAHDFDGDGFDDLIVMNLEKVTYYTGGPDGLSFSSVITNDSGQFFSNIYKGDFNGDGIMDVLAQLSVPLGDTRQTAFSVFDGALGFSATETNALFLASEGIYDQTFTIPANTIGDVDGDGADEFFFAPVFNGMKGYLVDFDDVFRFNLTETASNVDFNFGAEITALGDVSGDGLDDFAVGTFQDNILHVFRGNSAGNYRSADFSVNQTFKHIGSGNFNGDEFPDMVLFNPIFDPETQDAVNIYHGGTDFDLMPDQSFNITSQPMNGEFELELVSASLEFGVISDRREGALDDLFILTPFGSNGILIELENSEESNIPTLRYNSTSDLPLGRSNPFVNKYFRTTVGDFNSDGIPDIVAAEESTNMHVYSAYINVAPDITAGSFEVEENANEGTVVGSISFSDINENIDETTLRIIAGDDEGAFSIQGTQLVVNDGSLIDFESENSLTLTLEIADKAGLTATALFDIAIADVNEAPTLVDADLTIDELQAAGTEVGSVEFSDPEDDDLTFMIISGNTADAFAIDNDGVLTINEAAAIDIDDNPTFELAIEASDSEFIVSATVSIQLLDVNEAPVVTDADLTIDELVESGTEGGVIEFSDPEGDALTFSIVAGNTGDAFAVDNAGLLTVNSAEPLDIDDNPTFSLTIEVSDTEFTTSAIINIALLDVNETPVVEDAVFEINGRPEPDAQVGVLVFSDPEDDELVFEILSGNSAGIFAIDNQGIITAAAPDQFVSNDPIELTVAASDGEFSVEANVTFNLNNVLSVRIEELEVYPNPSSGRFVISGSFVQSSDASISVMDMAGKLVSYEVSKISDTQRELLIGSGFSGTLLIRIETNEGFVYRKVVIK